MPLTVDRITLDSGVQVLALNGTMTMGSQLQSFEMAVADLIQRQQNKIVIDMSQVTYIDSSAIGVLVGCHTLVRGSGGQMRLAGLAERVQKIFKLAGVLGVMSVDATRDDAIAQFGVHQ